MKRLLNKPDFPKGINTKKKERIKKEFKIDMAEKKKNKKQNKQIIKAHA